MGWLETTQDAIYKALCASFRIDPESEEGMKRFAPAYLFPATTPIADRNVDVCYYDIKPGEDEGLNYETIEYAPKDDPNVLASIKRNMPVEVLITFYGPNADNDSEKFWSLCQADTDYRSPRAVLRGYDILFNGKPGFPVGLQEIEGTYIRRRCDVQLNLILRDVHKVEYGYVNTPPDMHVWESIINWNGLKDLTWENCNAHTWGEFKTGLISGIHYQT